MTPRTCGPRTYSDRSEALGGEVNLPGYVTTSKDTPLAVACTSIVPSPRP